jgi:hypothetical protein
LVIGCKRGAVIVGVGRSKLSESDTDSDREESGRSNDDEILC